MLMEPKEERGHGRVRDAGTAGEKKVCEDRAWYGIRERECWRKRLKTILKTYSHRFAIRGEEEWYKSKRWKNLERGKSVKGY